MHVLTSPLVGIFTILPSVSVIIRHTRCSATRLSTGRVGAVVGRRRMSLALMREGDAILL